MLCGVGWGPLPCTRPIWAWRPEMGWLRMSSTQRLFLAFSIACRDGYQARHFAFFNFAWFVTPDRSQDLRGGAHICIDTEVPTGSL
jgi:hypothetical protein